MNLFDSLNLTDMPGAPVVDEPKRPLLECDGDGDDYILRVDNSTLETFQSCSRAAEFHCVERRQKNPSAALAFGGALHEGLEILYRDGFNALPAAIARTMEVLDRVKFRDPDEWRTPMAAQETLEKYVSFYSGHDPIEPITYASKLFIEVPFSLTIGEVVLNSHIAKLGFFVRKLTILWSGRIDIAANYGDANAYVVDHKTTSMGGPTFFGDFMLSQQMVGYVWALRQMLPEHNVVGTVVNAIMQRKPTKTGKSLEFLRQVYFHTDWHVDEWKRDVLSEIERFLSCLIDGYFPKATKWCFGKYGPCPYHDVCTLPPAQRQFMLDGSEYVNVSWSPLAPR